MVQAIGTAIGGAVGAGGLGTSIITGVVGLGFSVGAAVLASALQKKPKAPAFSGSAGQASTAASVELNFRGALTPRRFLFGRSIVKGAWRWAASYGPKHERLVQVHVLTGAGAITGWGPRAIVDGQPVTLAAPDGNGWRLPAAGQPFHDPADPLLRLRVIDGSQTTADGYLLQVAAAAGKTAEWTADHVGRDCAYVIAEMRFDPEQWQRGAPDLALEVQGHAVRDPRLGADAWVYTDNWALCVAHWLTHPLGHAVPWADLDEDLLIAAANVSDEAVLLKGGGTQKRYTLNGPIDADPRRREAIRQMLVEHAQGALFEVGGVWQVHAGADTPPVMDLSPDDFIGPVRISRGLPLESRAEVVRATYVDDATSEPTESPVWPPGAVASVYEEVLDLPLVRGAERAQRLQKAVRMNRFNDVTVSTTARQRCLALEPMDVVRLNWAEKGWAHKLFRVLRTEHVWGEGVELVLAEHDPNAWAWDQGEVVDVDPVPASNLVPPTLDRFARVEGANIIVNGDFSRGLAGWRIEGDPDLVEVVADAELRSGWALRLTTAVADQVSPIVWSRPVPVQPGSYVTIGGMRRREAGVLAASGGRWLYRFSESDGTPFPVDIRGDIPVPTTPWGRQFYSIQVPLAAASVELGLRASGLFESDPVVVRMGDVRLVAEARGYSRRRPASPASITSTAWTTIDEWPAVLAASRLDLLGQWQVHNPETTSVTFELRVLVDGVDHTADLLGLPASVTAPAATLPPFVPGAATLRRSGQHLLDGGLAARDVVLQARRIGGGTLSTLSTTTMEWRAWLQ